MKDISILKQARKLNQLIVDGRILLGDLDALVENGLDIVVVETWKKYSKMAFYSASSSVEEILYNDIYDINQISKSLYQKIFDKLMFWR